MIVTISLVILVIPNFVNAQSGSIEVIDFNDINTEKLLDKEDWGNSLPTFIENGSYIFIREDGVQLNDRNHGKIWRFTVDEGGVHYDPLVYSNNIFISDTTGNVSRISLNGELIWKIQYGRNIHSRLVLINNTIIFDVWDLP